MKKVTLAFPSSDSLWQFHLQTSAINVVVAPRKNTITGVFTAEEISIAENHFAAIQVSNNSAPVSKLVTSSQSQHKILFNLRSVHLFTMWVLGVGHRTTHEVPRR